MCGIAGFVENRSRQPSSTAQARLLLERILHALEHRGPDDWGMVFGGFSAEPRSEDRQNVAWKESAGTRFALGHRRLSILDLSAAGRQPMTSVEGTLTITFNGEIYNYIELRQELSQNADFQTGTDTEVLLEAYRQWGRGMLGRLDGMFAFALWDARTHKLICARDSLGIKPFYYAVEDGRFLFASEPRAILEGLGSAGHIDTAHIGEFLVLGVSDHDEGTSYREVRQLRGGQWLEVQSEGRVSIGTFWQPCVGEGEIGEDAPAQVRAQLELAIQRQLRSDVPVGSCLSGGLDSGSIIALVGKILGHRAKQFTTLTLANEEFEGDEAALACLTARHVGVNWVRVEPVIHGIPQEIESLVKTMDEPFSGLSIYGQYKVMERARAHGLKVMLDGQGGDEVFLGYPRVALRIGGEHFNRGHILAALHEWRALRHNASLPLATSLLGNVFFGSPRLAHWRNRRRLNDLVVPDLLDQIRPEVIQGIYSPKKVHDIQIAEMTQYVLPRLLRYEDRNSMAFSLEARVPLLAVGLVELGLRLPLHWKVRDGWTKYALRTAMQDCLPPEILWHSRKRGFEVPQRRWVAAARSQIALWLSDLPHDCPIRTQPILTRIDAGQGGAPFLWRCLSVALWMRFSGVHV